MVPDKKLSLGSDNFHIFICNIQARAKESNLLHGCYILVDIRLLCAYNINGKFCYIWE